MEEEEAAQPTQPKPLVLWVNMREHVDFWHKFHPVLIALRRIADFEEAKTYAAARNKLMWSFADIILITDEAIVSEGDFWLWRLVLENVSRGAKAILMGSFGAHVPRHRVEPFFRLADLRWGLASCLNTTFSLNYQAINWDDDASYGLPVEIVQDSVLLSRVPIQQAWYVSPLLQPMDSMEVPVAVARLGLGGYICFIGALGREPDTPSVVLCMCMMR